jgi:alcohol dehydrogenase class IV
MLLPMVAVPTTAGSGSEATHFAVVYRDGIKSSIADDRIFPDTVILDPSLLTTLPPYQRRVGALDALCQAIESIWSRGASAESRELAQAAIRQLLDSLPTFLAGNSPRNSLAGMLRAANLAGRAINLSKTTLPHAMSYGLTTSLGISHGHAVALLTEPIWRLHADRAKDHSFDGAADLSRSLLEIAHAFGAASTDGAIRRFHDLLSAMELPTPAHDQAILADLVSGINPDRMANNPVAFGTTALRSIYVSALGGCVP